MEKKRKIIWFFALGFPGLCLVTLSALAIANLSAPKHSPMREKLSQSDKVRLAEFQHLRTTLGDSVWPDWGHADIPVILYNEEYAFLIGDPAPVDGWIKVPGGDPRGWPWELAPDDFLGSPYYRQKLSDPEITPEAFTVRVGDRWVASMTTFDWLTIGMQQNIQQDLPAFVQPIFPYKLLIGQLVSGSDQYISLLAHESFHAFQGMNASEKLASSERSNMNFEDQYPWSDADLQAAWQVELDLLAECLQTADKSKMIELAKQFVAVRTQRREAAGLSSDLIRYEKQREWLEGLARYAELEIWHQASMSRYQPLDEVNILSDFENYTGFAQRWQREIGQISRMADDRGDGRFYYSGMAQAVLLDRLTPGWKQHAFDEGVWLDDLLADATSD